MVWRGVVAPERKIGQVSASSEIASKYSTVNDFDADHDTYPEAPLCDDEIDWETIVDYLSQCQSVESVSITTIDRVINEEPSLKQSDLYKLPPSIRPHRYTMNKRDDSTSTSLHLRTQPTPVSLSPSSSAIPRANQGLSTGAKAGIVGSVAIGIVIVLATLVTLHTRRRRKKYGYTRTKGQDSMATELDGQFVVTTWPDHGEASPMINSVHTMRESEGHVGLGQERVPGEVDSHYEMEGHRVESPEEQYIVSPETLYSAQTPHTSIYSPMPQPYLPSPLLNRSPSPPQAPDPYEQHNRRSRPSHPLASLSEAIPPPQLLPRRVHSMAEYQNAVPLGYSNGFVQVGQSERTPDTPTRKRTWDSIQPTYELDLAESSQRGRIDDEADVGRGLIPAQGHRANDEREGLGAKEQSEQHDERQGSVNRAVDLERVEGDAELPQYEEMPGSIQKEQQRLVSTRHVRESVRWDQATGRYHIDDIVESGSEDEGEETRRELTKEELG